MNDILDSINFLTDKFKAFGNDSTEKHKIIENINVEVKTLSRKVLKFEKTADQQKQCSRRNSILLHRIVEHTKRQQMICFLRLGVTF